MAKQRVRVRHTRVKHKRLPRFGKEILMLLAVFIAVGIGRILVHETAHKKSPSTTATSEWKTYHPGESQLSLSLPGEPQAEHADVPDSIRANVKQVNRYKYARREFHVAVWDISYVDGVPVDIQKAADGAVSALKQSGSATEYQDNITPITRSGRSGLLVRASYKRYGERTLIDALLLGDGTKLWQVIITHPASDDNGRIASNTILDSVKID